MTAPEDRGTLPIQERGVMPEITDEYMQEMLGKSKTYTAMLLRVTEKASKPDGPKIIWEHGRRNFALRADGKLPIVCPAADESDWAGVGIFDATPEEVERIMADDPGSRQGSLPTSCTPSAASPAPALP